MYIKKKHHCHSHCQVGFTLVELLIVIGIISILASVIVVVISPGEKMKSARESTRAAHFSSIGSAFYLNVVKEDDFGGVAEVLEETECNGDDEDNTTSLSWDIAREFTNDCALLIGLGSAPVDPQDSAEYRIKATADGAGGRLMFYTTSSESEWQEGNPVIH